MERHCLDTGKHPDSYPQTVPGDQVGIGRDVAHKIMAERVRTPRMPITQFPFKDELFVRGRTTPVDATGPRR